MAPAAGLCDHIVRLQRRRCSSADASLRPQRKVRKISILESEPGADSHSEETAWTDALVNRWERRTAILNVLSFPSSRALILTVLRRQYTVTSESRTVGERVDDFLKDESPRPSALTNAVVSVDVGGTRTSLHPPP